jgi:hypothetical protein
VPHPTDKSDTDTLPDPELNPLLNPLLAAHMGRWAEVYFTTPPEKRGEAVSDLLRELQNGSPPESASVPIIHHETSEERVEAAEADALPIDAEFRGVCGACAYKNSAGQNFCGMCGASLQISPEAHLPQVADARPIFVAQRSERERFVGSRSVPEDAIEPEFTSTTSGKSHDSVESAWTLPIRSLPHFGAESEYEADPSRYRLYIGVVLAVLLTLMVYMAWRSTKAVSGSTSVRFAPSIAVPAANPHAPIVSTQPGTSGTDSPESSSLASPVQNENQPQTSSRKNKPRDAPQAPTIVRMAANSSSIVAEPSGAEDLATAEKYLNGTLRDHREAALWLWKAVGKGNLAATMTLSDLYLRGDGVPKSCDQARLLLDAAARKGGTAAAERLRNLQAFGCE